MSSEEPSREDIKNLLDYNKYEDYVDANYTSSVDIKFLQVGNESVSQPSCFI